MALFFGTFAWSFVYVSWPFYIQRRSPGDRTSTLRWTGWILGISPLTTVVTAPLWGRLAGHRNPRTFYVVVELLQGVGFFLMALARTLPELFLARLLLGVMGAASTFAFIIAGRSESGELRREVSAIQSAMTVGQVLGPLAGAVAAARPSLAGCVPPTARPAAKILAVPGHPQGCGAGPVRSSQPGRQGSKGVVHPSGLTKECRSFPAPGYRFARSRPS